MRKASPGSSSASTVSYTHLDRMIEAAFKRQREREALTFSYDVNLLAGVSLGGAKSSAGCK